MKDASHSRPFDSEAGFRQAIDLVIAAARYRLCVFDRDLERMALERPERCAALTQFLAGGSGGMRIAVHDPTPLECRCPRLVLLLRNFSHAVEVRRMPDNLSHVADCFLLADQAHAAIRFHIDHARGKLLLDAPGEARPWFVRFEEIWAAASPCSPATAFGR